MSIHKDLAQGRWFAMTLAEQLGNAGSEYNRAVNWKQTRDKRFDAALARFRELMDLTVSDPRWRGVRRKELARAREESMRVLDGMSSAEQSRLLMYFATFGYLARSKH